VAPDEDKNELPLTLTLPPRGEGKKLIKGLNDSFSLMGEGEDEGESPG
jgi:hypothetical protein